MTYRAPIDDMRFVLEDLCGFDQVAALPGLEEMSSDVVAAILEEAAKFAGQVLAPLNPVGDTQGSIFADGKVRTPNGWSEAYQHLMAMGWNSPAAAPESGGMGLPHLVNACIQEMFQGANAAFQLCPMLTQGAVEAIQEFASPELKSIFLPKLASGEWTGTMNLTEPQAGSDLAAIRTSAVPEGDHFRVTGQKIFITYGEHDLTENIVHLVLARLPDAPAGVKGLSLFVVPKYLVGANGTIGERNHVRCVSIEHKLGVHASPTCTLVFGEDKGAIGHLIGEPHRGIEYMFAMMNHARLSVGLQGIGIAEHATQRATAYAVERQQGRPVSDAGVKTIIGHPDIRRMLALMKSRTEAARILAYRAARSLDHAERDADADLRAYHRRRVGLLIPVVKGWATETSNHSASLGVQIHGGMGFIEETGAAQYLRDARITTIYEGTTGIQALDLVGRKIVRDQGRAVFEIVSEMRESAAAIGSETSGDMDWPSLSAKLADAADCVENVTHWLLVQSGNEPQAAASSVLELFGVTLGAWGMADAALVAARRTQEGGPSDHLKSKLNLAAFYMTNVLPLAKPLRAIITEGAASIDQLQAADFGEAV